MVCAIVVITLIPIEMIRNAGMSDGYLAKNYLSENVYLSMLRILFSSSLAADGN